MLEHSKLWIEYLAIAVEVAAAVVIGLAALEPSFEPCRCSFDGMSTTRESRDTARPGAVARARAGICAGCRYSSHSGRSELARDRATRGYRRASDCAEREIAREEGCTHEVVEQALRNAAG
jgi:hypothetical protein